MLTLSSDADLTEEDRPPGVDQDGQGDGQEEQGS